MTTLTYKNLTRQEEDLSTIDNLIRKGWMILNPKPPQPEYDSRTEKIIYNTDENTYSIVPLSIEELQQISNFKIQELIAQKNKQIEEKIKSGYTVSPERFTLSLTDNDRTLFSQMLLLIKEALDLGLIDNSAPQTISDKDGNSQTITTLRFRQIMVGYGMYYKSLWDQME